VIGSEDGNVTVLSLCPLQLNSSSSPSMGSSSCHHASTVTGTYYTRLRKFCESSWSCCFSCSLDIAKQNCLTGEWPTTEHLERS